MTPSLDLLSKIKGDIESDAPRIQDFFVKMLKINAVNPRMGGPGELERASFLESFLRGEGFDVERADASDKERGFARPNLSTKLVGKDRSRTLWFLSHMDTVPEGTKELWKTDPFDPKVVDGKIIARGAEDNGQSLVASLFALRELKKIDADLPFNVGVWFVADEESGSKFGVKYLLDGDYFRPNDLIMVPDAGSPKGTDIEVAEKNLLWFKIITKGRQVHASLPGKGKNAHRIAMKLALALDENLHERFPKSNQLFDEPRSTFEPTKIEPNVPNINTIPGVDTSYFDCRVLPEYSLNNVLSAVQAEIQEFAKRYDTEIELSIVAKEDAGPATSESSDVAKYVVQAVRKIRGIEPRFVGIGGQTVGNLFRQRGFATAVWSTVDEVPHEPNEYSRIENLISDAKVFASIPLLAWR